MTTSVDHCFICSASDTPLQDVGTHGQPFDSQLPVILLLRKVLRLRRSFLVSLLQNTGENPTSWNLKICQVCHRVFEEASFVWSRLNKLTEDFEDLSETLRTKLVACSENGGEEENGGGGMPVSSGHGLKRRAGRPRKNRTDSQSKANADLQNIEGSNASFSFDAPRLPEMIRTEVVKGSARDVSMPNITHFTLGQTQSYNHDVVIKGAKSLRPQKTAVPALNKDGPSSNVKSRPVSCFETGTKSIERNAVVSASVSVLLERDKQLDEMVARGSEDLDGYELPDDDLMDDILNADYSDAGETVPEFYSENDGDDGGLLTPVPDSDYVPEQETRPTQPSSKSSEVKLKDDDSEKGLLCRPIKLENMQSFQCSKCRRTFGSQASCNEHILLYHYNGKRPEGYSCSFCEKKFKGAARLKNHMKMRHPGKKSGIDEILDRSIQDGAAPEVEYQILPVDQKEEDVFPEESLKLARKQIRNHKQPVFRHVKITDKDQPPPDPFAVPVLATNGKVTHYIVCDDFANFPDAIQKLLKRIDKPCPICPNKVIPTELQFIAHMKRTHEGDLYPFECPLCPRKLERIGKILLHFVRLHVDRGKYYCPKCNARCFQEEMSLQAHVQRIHFGIPNPFKCKMCPQTFEKRYALNVHLTNVHNHRIAFYDPSQPENDEAGISVRIRKTRSNDAKEKLRRRRKKSPAPPEFTTTSKENVVASTSKSVIAERDEQLNELVVEGNEDASGIQMLDDDSFHTDMDEVGVDTAVSDASDSDSDYQPESEEPPPKRSKRSIKGSKEANSEGNGVVHRAIKLEQMDLFQCSKCSETFENISLCNEHILKEHYNGKWPKDFPCSFCDKKFKRSAWLKYHMKMRHPGQKSHIEEMLERSIQDGSAPEVKYLILPVDQKEEDVFPDEFLKLGAGKQKRSYKPFRYVMMTGEDQPPPDPLAVPVLASNGKVTHYIVCDDFANFPETIQQLLKRTDKECPMCSKVMPTDLQFNAHMKGKHEGDLYPYECPLCPRKLERVGKLLEHILRLHVERGKYNCTRCKWSFEEEITLQAHVQNKHFGIRNPYKCQICQGRFERRSKLNRHLICVHKHRIAFYNPVAKRGGGGGQRLKVPAGKRKLKHGKKFGRPKGGKKAKVVPCQLCRDEDGIENMFEDEQELDVHVKKSHLKIPRPYACSVCTKKYSHPNLVVDHQLKVHTVRNDVSVDDDETPRESFKFYCSPCNKSFKTEGMYKYHLMAKFHNRVRPYVCEICSKAFRELKALQNHQSQMHHEELKIEPHKCTYCGKILCSERNLNDHIRVVHTKNARFNCPHCDYHAMYKHSFDKHMNVRHTKSEVSLCPYCAKSFLNPQSLQNHLRVHSGEKPYECKICSKRFADKPTYNRHVEAHKNIIHTCPHCQKSGFKTRHALRVHIRTKHEEVLNNQETVNTTTPEGNESNDATTSQQSL